MYWPNQLISLMLDLEEKTWGKKLGSGEPVISIFFQLYDILLIISM